LSLRGNFLLDTNILIQLVRDNWIGRSIDSRFQLRSCPESPLVCIVTVGEAFALARKLGWGSSRTSILEDLIAQFAILDINSEEVLSAYAEIDCFLERSGKSVEQNDIWIAATTVVAGAHLLTTDKDFDPLYPDFLDRTWIDPQRPDA
jgi:tRNA(fMet)-specific endonuclease VapC